MGGILTHAIIGVASSYLFYRFIDKKWFYAVVVFCSNLFPDSIRHVGAGIEQRTLNIFAVEKTRVYERLDYYTQHYVYWLFGIAVLFGFIFVLEKLNLIDKNKFDIGSKLILAFFIGVTLHFIWDLIFQEGSIWI